MSRDTADRDWLEPNDARGKLFDETLEQLAACDLFSNTALGEPTIFLVYAHENVAVGDAREICVHELISWFQKIKAGILSDKSALPPLTSDQGDTSPLRNIIANQIRLLPPSANTGSDEATACIDKVMVCGSEVLERYCQTAYASKYINEVVAICNHQESLSMKTLKLLIEGFVEGEAGKDGFHHVLTEIAFLRVRKYRLPDRHGMVPVALDGAHHVPYLSVFVESDITFKLKSTSAADKHRLFFQLLEQLFVRHNALANDFKNCYNKVVEELKLPVDATHHVSLNHFYDCMNSNMTKMYHKHWSTFSTAMRNGKFNEYAGVLGQHVLDILDRDKAKERREILQWVSPMAAPPMPGKYEDGRAKRLVGTCDWVIKDDKFIEWYGNETSAMISLQGSMGMGKTYATSRVIEWIQRSPGESDVQYKALAYFYCIEQDEMSNNAKAILRSIVGQIAAGPMEGAPLDEAIVNMWNKHGQRFDTTTLDEWEDCASEIINNFHGATIVLDALDECKTAQRTDLTKVFSSLAERCSNLKIFVSTRPESDLRRWLEKQPSISMHNGRTSGDIAAFVQDKIAQHSEWPYMDHELKELLLKTIVKKSQGLFLCAHLQIENLQDCLYEDDVRNALATLPQKLTELYERLYICAAIKPAEKKFRDRALRWVLSSLRPLTSEELLFAISQDPHADCLTPLRRDVSERLLLKSCHNFLTLGSSNTEHGTFEDKIEGSSPPVWRLAHQAVAEFFEHGISCADERADMHYEAAMICLMLSLNTFSGSAIKVRKMDDYQCPCQSGIHSEVSLGSEEHVMLREPLVEYAIHAWPTHVRTHENQEYHHNGRLSQVLLKFLNNPQEGCLIYQRWFKHAVRVREHASWSAVFQRRLWTIKSNNMMSPISFVCYMGFPKTLAELLKSVDADKATHYDASGWEPWEDGLSDPIPHITGEQWSAVALACSHDEVNVLRCLLSSEPPARLDIIAADEIPPIVAAAMGDSVEVARELLQPQHALSMRSSFTEQHGHVIRFAIWGDSLQVLSLLLDQAFDSPTLEEALTSVDLEAFQSTKAISMLLGKGVGVNTPLKDGTLLAAAVNIGDECLVLELLEKGANANTEFQHRKRSLAQKWDIKNALEACIRSWYEQTNSDSVARLLVQGGATVTARTVAIAADWRWSPFNPTFDDQLHQNVLRLLVTRMSDPNEIFSDDFGNPTCALYQATLAGNIASVELLLDRGADPKLLQEGAIGERFADGGQLRKLGGPGASARAGVMTRVAFFLERGADPNALHDGHYQTALTAAVASVEPEAPDIVRMLLPKTDVNVRLPDPGFLSRTRFALDQPLWSMLSRTAEDLRLALHHQNLEYVKRLRTLTRSAFVLASNGAVWDVDFEQWRECLKKAHPEFESQEVETLDTIQEHLERNWNRLSASQKASDEWRIKDPLAAESVQEFRSILAVMKIFLSVN